MATEVSENSLQFYARFAGLTYLVSGALYVPPPAFIASLEVPGDFAQTAHNVATSEFLYRLALSSLLVGFVTIIVLGWAFYTLLKPVNPRLALLALLCRTVEAALMGVSAVLWFAALRNYTEAGDAGMRVLLDKPLTGGINTSFHFALVCSSIRSGLFLFLLFKSRYVPRILAGFDMSASALALALAFALLLVPEQVSSHGMAGWGPIFIAEVATGLWLLIAGASFSYWNNRSELASTARTADPRSIVWFIDRRGEPSRWFQSASKPHVRNGRRTSGSTHGARPPSLLIRFAEQRGR